MHEAPAAPLLLAQLAPLFIISALLAAIFAAIAPRKGRSRFVAFLAFIPFVNGLYAIWLCSLTDVSVLRDIEELKRGRDERSPISRQRTPEQS